MQHELFLLCQKVPPALRPSCKEYIEYIRVTKAEDLLLFSDYDLTYISQETGFSDCSHMIKTFRKYKNITPKQYRLQNTKALH